ncbi:hypothetical protein E4U17_002563 [Claviceps sp. LM77 group G4]|nr:hypothetical protein E4U17_002563 [Claviceps sp. LM77 group G4]KAG6072612.1 hypothetical protein E4U16_005236 [Claviceps sp. LM84 group G4]KAG6074406.1 hypothetical protein E4U33_002525 [Claviceps sp. LM78 group G4]
MVIVKALLFLGVVSSNVLAIEAPIPGYDVETLNRNVHLDSRDGGDSPITLSGTIEEGTSKAKKLNSRWARNLEMRKPLLDDETRRSTIIREWPSKVECIDIVGGPWYRTDLRFIQDGLHYLKKHSGKPKLGPGPDKCDRVSCSYHSSIWWCNKKSEPLELSSFKEMVRIAGTIVEDCVGNGEDAGLVGGEAFMKDWSIIIRQDNENC